MGSVIPIKLHEDGLPVAIWLPMRNLLRLFCEFEVLRVYCHFLSEKSPLASRFLEMTIDHMTGKLVNES